MRRMALSLALVGFAAAAAPVGAQDIIGLSFRATDAAPEGAGNGKVDILQEGDGYTVSVDLSGNAEAFGEQATSGDHLVVWGIDMDGKRHNLGTLDESYTLTDAPAGFMVAMVYVTAEADAAAVNPTTDPLFNLTLRKVTEVETTAEEAAAAAESSEGSETAAASAPAAAPAKPQELPTTGTLVRDLAVLLAVAAAFVAGGLRLRAIRL